MLFLFFSVEDIEEFLEVTIDGKPGKKFEANCLIPQHSCLASSKLPKSKVGKLRFFVLKLSGNVPKLAQKIALSLLVRQPSTKQVRAWGELGIQRENLCGFPGPNLPCPGNQALH